MNNNVPSMEGVWNSVQAFVQGEADRRRRLVPGTLSIRMNGTEIAALSERESPVAVVPDKGVTTVELIGHDGEGEVVLAVYVLTYDSHKTEVWRVKLPWHEEVSCRFEYGEDDSVVAKFELVPAFAAEEEATKSTEHFCYCTLFNRYIDLGIRSKLKEREHEFKDRKSAAAIFGKSPKTLDHMIEENRVASIKVGGSLLIHIPTSAALLRARKLWETCPKCPQT